MNRLMCRIFAGDSPDSSASGKAETAEDAGEETGSRREASDTGLTPVGNEATLQAAPCHALGALQSNL